MEKIIINNGYLEYQINDLVEIINIKGKDVEKLLTKLIIITNHLNKNYLNKSNVDLSNYNFINNVLSHDHYSIKRFIKIGNYETGELNNLCDVKGIKVAHATIHKQPYHTGLTLIKPCEENIFKNKVVAASYAFNGFGKSIGLMQIDELGTIETNIALTSTLNVTKVASGMVEEILKENPEIGESTGTVNPIVLECNDGTLNKSRDMIVGHDDYVYCLNHFNNNFLQGDVGAGSGMICHGLKGGIGSSSRIIRVGDVEYHLAILVNSNFGESRARDFILKGKEMGPLIASNDELLEEKGSIVAVVATDAPLNERQIKRVLKRVEMGIARTGSYAGNGSGDVFIGFSTANRREHFNKEATSFALFLSDNNINPFFKACVDMTQEAIYNSMFFSHHLVGYHKEVKCLMEYHQLFDELLDGEIIWKKSGIN